MSMRQATLLEIVERYPETEDVFRTYDSVLGKCVLCHHLFDTIDILEKEYLINLDDLVEKLECIIKPGQC